MLLYDSELTDLNIRKHAEKIWSIREFRLWSDRFCHLLISCTM